MVRILNVAFAREKTLALFIGLQIRQNQSLLVVKTFTFVIQTALTSSDLPRTALTGGNYG